MWLLPHIFGCPGPRYRPRQELIEPAHTPPGQTSINRLSTLQAQNYRRTQPVLNLCLINLWTTVAIQSRPMSLLPPTTTLRGLQQAATAADGRTAPFLSDMPQHNDKLPPSELYEVPKIGYKCRASAHKAPYMYYLPVAALPERSTPPPPAVAAANGEDEAAAAANRPSVLLPRAQCMLPLLQCSAAPGACLTAASSDCCLL